MSKNNKVTNNPDPEVLAKPKRRTFTKEYKQRILKEYAETEVGKKGAILRREGLYSSHIASWRRAHMKVVLLCTPAARINISSKKNLSG